MSFSDDPQAPPLPRGPTSQPFRGPTRTRRSDGQREVWVEGRGYVPETSLDRLSTPERTQIEEARANALRMQSYVPDLDRFEELNRTNRTGSWGQRLGQLFGDIPELVSPNEDAIDEMRSITDRLTPRQRPAGAGSTSDFDAAMYRGSLPHRGRDGPANSQIIANLRREARDAQAWSEFLDWWYPRNGNLNGATEAWGEYMRQPQRGEWRSYFGAQEQQQATGGPAPQQRQPGRTRYDANGRPIR